MDMQNKILASVAGNPITEADLEMALAAMGQRGQAYNNPQGRAVLLEQLIAQKLFLMDAQKNLMEREPEFKEQLKQVKEEMLTNYAIKKAVERVKVTDDEIQKFYDENPDQFEAGMTYNASHILVDSEEKAAEIAAQINAGDISFEDAAKANSTCPSGQQGGELGDFGHGQMVPEFEAACDALEAGEMSAPVQTQFGWHLVKLNKKEDGGKMELAEVKEQIRQVLMQQKQQAAYQSRVNQLKILFPVDKNNTL
ncbi:MAG: peptidyl-prolyl cis-trans isomerase [Clostridia bacterium]|nr:peptidyl-prolyl cis-trans isomerase [Clostridia bacterium]